MEWKSVKEKLKNKFGKLSGSDIDSLNGHMDQLEPKIKKAYGYTDEKAKKECKVFNESIKK